MKYQTMSFLISLAVSSASSVVYYTAKGVWVLAKRMVWGRQPTAEEKLAAALQLLAQREEEMLQRQSALEEQQHTLAIALETHFDQNHSQSSTHSRFS